MIECLCGTREALGSNPQHCKKQQQKVEHISGRVPPKSKKKKSEPMG
jgi:hypothetical protein